MIDKALGSFNGLKIFKTISLTAIDKVLRQYFLVENFHTPKSDLGFRSLTSSLIGMGIDGAHKLVVVCKKFGKYILKPIYVYKLRIYT